MPSIIVALALAAPVALAQRTETCVDSADFVMEGLHPKWGMWDEKKRARKIEAGKAYYEFAGKGCDWVAENTGEACAKSPAPGWRGLKNQGIYLGKLSSRVGCARTCTGSGVDSDQWAIHEDVLPDWLVPTNLFRGAYDCAWVALDTANRCDITGLDYPHFACKKSCNACYEEFCQTGLHPSPEVHEACPDTPIAEGLAVKYVSMTADALLICAESTCNPAMCQDATPFTGVPGPGGLFALTAALGFPLGDATASCQPDPSDMALWWRFGNQTDGSYGYKLYKDAECTKPHSSAIDFNSGFCTAGNLDSLHSGDCSFTPSCFCAAAGLSALA